MSVTQIVMDMPRSSFENSAAGFIIETLQDAIQLNGQASLFLSGGSTPGPIYEKLSSTCCHWHKVHIGLVDERWVDAKNKGSNAALIRRTLLKNGAKQAHFVPLKTSHKTPKLAQSFAQANYTPLFEAPSLAVLGMGLDGHICSWFPNAEGLSEAIDPENKDYVQAIKARPSKTAGLYLDRMTLTLSALKRCRKILLLMSGAEKKSIFERAMASKEIIFPISHLIHMTQSQSEPPLTILHAA